MKAETEKAYRASITKATEAGAQVLDKGGSSLDAVEAAIKILEDDPLFNAGRGADFAADGKNQLDAAIMDGSNMKAGAVGDVLRTRNPISLARAVMEKSPARIPRRPGRGRVFCLRRIEQVDQSYFFTERRWQSLVKELKKEGLPIPPRPAGAPPACRASCRNGTCATRTSTAPSAWSRSTGRATSQPEHPPAAPMPSAGVA